MLNNRSLSMLSTAVVLYSSLFSCGPRTGTGDVKIGAVLLLSGDNALWGDNARKAIQLLADQVNQAGGVSGRRLGVIYEDSRGDPKTAVTALRKLVDIDRVGIVLETC